MPSCVPVAIELTDDERAQLEAWTRRRTSAQALALRSRIVLAAAEGLNNTEIADHLEFPLQQVEDLRRASRTPVSLNAAVGDEEDTELGHLIADDAAEAPDVVAEEAAREQAVQNALECLSPLERRVLQLRYGLAGEMAHTLPAIAKQLGITANRARLVEGAALERLLTLPEGRALRSAA